MNIERLQELTKLLSVVVPETLDLGDWKCETTCCAVGHACNHPIFIEQGLHWDSNNYPAYKELTNWSAVEAFFDISENVAEYLFSEDSYPVDQIITPQSVIERINDIIEDSELYDFITNQ